MKQNAREFAHVALDYAVEEIVSVPGQEPLERALIGIGWALVEIALSLRQIAMSVER